ncbi:cytochrome c oxidase subunit 3 [Bordetella bronchialis]|uniref:Cytochrome C oxidase subunit III n=1 Tax=Bordetella bronchialis TaxID=463025 RepID=A0ABN4QYD8_9BORD|nr:cytochrome c oxidase subunit 3 [Bordetella bronchialis]ANN66047.1 cytochrome C oxidase subunit III [Bordetella bronchialis]
MTHRHGEEVAVAAGTVIDVSGLPTYGFGHRSLMWWGTMGLMLIEGTVFAIGVMSYFYLRGLAPQWPIAADPPALAWGTANTVLLLASLWPNHLAKRAAERQQRARAALWVVVCVVLAAVFLALRALEFTALNVSWNENAYGALVWFLLGLHTTHLITDTVDTAVLAALLFTQRFDGRRYVDVSENAMYWYFVVFSWVPIYAVIYLAPRF